MWMRNVSMRLMTHWPVRNLVAGMFHKADAIVRGLRRVSFTGDRPCCCCIVLERDPVLTGTAAAGRASCTARRDDVVPVPSVTDLDELDAQLLAGSRSDEAHTIAY
jgi:hypothetical protein